MNKLGKYSNLASYEDSHGKKAGLATKGHGKAFKNGGTEKGRKGGSKRLGKEIG